jgi:hypothetical protein
MSKVICIFSKVELKEDCLFDAINRREDFLESQVDAKVESKDFEEIAKKNKERDDKRKAERAKNNENVLKSYRIK